MPKKNKYKYSMSYYNAVVQDRISPAAAAMLKDFKKKTENFSKNDEKLKKDFTALFDRIKSVKPEAIKGTTAYKKMNEELYKKEEPKKQEPAPPPAPEPKPKRKLPPKKITLGNKERDAARVAKAPGYRIAGLGRKPTLKEIRAGKAYYEGRTNRADQNRRSYPFLAEGGELSKKEVGKLIDKYSDISTTAQVKSFFADLHKMDVNFHPDDDFADYVNMDDKPTFTHSEASRLNKIMDKCHKVCDKNNQDIYEIGIELVKKKFPDQFEQGGQTTGQEKEAVKYQQGDFVNVFQYASPADAKKHPKYIVNGGPGVMQKWSKVKILKIISDEPGHIRYRVRQIDGYRDTEEFTAYQSSMAQSNRKPIEIGYMAKGGKTASKTQEIEYVDLFEDYENQPPKVAKIIEKYDEAFQEGDYEKLAKALKELNAIGYTFEYYVDGSSYDLRKIGQKGKTEDPQNDSFAKGGKVKPKIVVTKISDLPGLKEKVKRGQVTYRGLGMGKLSNDFYKIAGTNGTRIKVDGKEYFITDTDFDTLIEWNGDKMLRFDAPYRYAKGGKTDQFYVAISESKDGHWAVLSRPSKLKSVAQVYADGPAARGEVHKVVTLSEALNHKKILGKEYLSKPDAKFSPVQKERLEKLIDEDKKYLKKIGIDGDPDEDHYQRLGTIYDILSDAGRITDEDDQYLLKATDEEQLELYEKKAKDL